MVNGPFNRNLTLSGAELVFRLEVEDEQWHGQEFVIEKRLRDKGYRSIEVVVSESFEHEGQTITLMPDRQEMEMFELNRLIKDVEELAGKEFDDDQITLKAK